jgi:NodT family efflux transporter outer membrane factor (OMF) lipoprotein
MIVSRSLLLCLLALIAVNGCAVGPALSPRSTIGAPSSLGQASSAVVDMPAVDRWWRLYENPTLDALVTEALENNRDLRVASANLAQAQAAFRERQSSRLPVTSVSSGIAYGSTVSDQIAAALDQTDIRTGQRDSAGVDMGWEVDLSGRITRAIQAARADAEAARAAEDSVRVAVAAETTRAYVESCGYASRTAVARKSLALVTRSWELKTRLRDAGGAMPLDVARSAALVEQARAAIPPVEAGRQNALYELAVLTGRPPDDISAVAAGCDAIPQLKAPIPIGDVTALLQRRPDIREAERRLRASTARIGVTTANLYPTVSIMGSVASSAPAIGSMSEHGSIVWGVGPVLSWSFPNVSAAHAQIAGAQAQEAAALARFDATILIALKEVKQALATYEAALRQRNALKSAARQSSEAVRLAWLGRSAGAASAFDVLDAERSDVEAEAMLASADANVATDQVVLFKALGGGWEQAPAVQIPAITRAIDAAH